MNGRSSGWLRFFTNPLTSKVDACGQLIDSLDLDPAAPVSHLVQSNSARAPRRSLRRAHLFYSGTLPNTSASTRTPYTADRLGRKRNGGLAMNTQYAHL